MKEVEPQEKPAKKKRRLAPVLFGLLFLVGFGILAYPTISNQWNTYRQNQLISNYEDNLQSLDATDFTDEWQKAEAFNQTITDNDLYGDVFGEDDGDLKNTDYWKVLNVEDNGVMGYLSIPKINIKLAIYHGTGDDVLQTGVGHLYEASDWRRKQSCSAGGTQRSAECQTFYRYRSDGSRGQILHPCVG